MRWGSCVFFYYILHSDHFVLNFSLVEMWLIRVTSSRKSTVVSVREVPFVKMAGCKQDEIALSYHDSLLRESDLSLLHGANWINDKIIGFYFE